MLPFPSRFGSNEVCGGGCECVCGGCECVCVWWVWVCVCGGCEGVFGVCECVCVVGVSVWAAYPSLARFFCTQADRHETWVYSHGYWATHTHTPQHFLKTFPIFFASNHDFFERKIIVKIKANLYCRIMYKSIQSFYLSMTRQFF